MLGVPVLGLALILLKVPFRVPRRYWPELALLLMVVAIASVLWPAKETA